MTSTTNIPQLVPTADVGSGTSPVSGPLEQELHRRLRQLRLA